MSEVKMLTAPVPNVPWQERPAGEFNGAPIWRYSENPIIGRNMKMVLSVYSEVSRPTVFHISILEEVRMQSIGVSKRIRFLS